MRADVEAAVTAQARQPASGQAPAAGLAQGGTGDTGEDSLHIPLTVMRKVMAERLTESASALHFFPTNVVVVDRMVALRAEINERFEESGIRVSVTDLLIKACALTLLENPRVNASWAGDKILQHRRAHIGVAVALDDGLIVPVVRDAAETRALSQQARDHTLAPAQFTGGTFTPSNLGMFGIDNFTAVINPPETAILAVGSTNLRALSARWAVAEPPHHENHPHRRSPGP